MKKTIFTDSGVSQKQATFTERWLNFGEIEKFKLIICSKLSKPQLCPQVPKISIYSVEEAKGTASMQI